MLLQISSGQGPVECEYAVGLLFASLQKEYPDVELIYANPTKEKECYKSIMFSSIQDLSRLDYRQKWEDDFLSYIEKLQEQKPVIFCGDLNVAHKEIDLKNPSSNHHNAGFTDEERNKFSVLMEHGFIDSFRHFYPDLTGAYSWWSYRFHAREKNAGWRIDYFITSNSLEDKLLDAKIHSDVMGSDHCPVELDIEVE